MCTINQSKHLCKLLHPVSFLCPPSGADRLGWSAIATSRGFPAELYWRAPRSCNWGWSGKKRWTCVVHEPLS